jgi:hypothetical protein
MKILRETLFERIRNRMAPANAVRTIAALQRAAIAGDIEYMAVKEASEMLARYKLEAQIAIRTFRSYQARAAVKAVLEPLKDQEGRILQQHARNAVSLYADAKRDYTDLWQLAMKGAANDDGSRP